MRTHTCGQLNLEHLNSTVTLCGWVKNIRNKGSIIWVDLRDRYGITQLMVNESSSTQNLLKQVRELGREYVVSATGTVIERISKNEKLPTGDIEILLTDLKVLNPSKLPPFLIEDETDGGDDLRMKYRYLDLRRNPLRSNLELRHLVLQSTRRYLEQHNFIEVETPVLIKSTPEGARDFIVPSRLNPREFYALPQSPQTFKQLLMVSGFDRYFQIAKCFRDEDLRADRQPEFTQIDCEMSFVTQEDILKTFEGMVKHIFKTVKGLDLPDFNRITYDDAMRLYGNDKPDTRFGMEFVELTDKVKGNGFHVFDEAELVVAINVGGCSSYTRKQIDELAEFVKQPKIGSKGLSYIRYQEDGTLRSSIDKFYDEPELKLLVDITGSKPGDLVLILSGELTKTRKAMSELRLEMGNRLGLRNKDQYQLLWVLDFPLLEYGEEYGRWFAMHHPFTSPNLADLQLLKDGRHGEIRANAYDLVINGVEVGGGSIRIHDRNLQEKMFGVLGFTPEDARNQFGFLMDAFEYGAPPHGGIAFGLDRLCALLAGQETIRDFIAFPKNNSGRDVMINCPSKISDQQLKELSWS